MVFEFYVIAVAVAAIIYSVITRVIQEKLMNKKETEELQAESKRLNGEYKKAKERNDKIKMDDVAKQQLDLFPRINKMMFGQLKIVGVILLVFFAFSTAVKDFDPHIKDDVQIELKNDGNGCDVRIDDTYTGCYKLNSDTYGFWTVKVKSLVKQVPSEKKIAFLYNSKDYIPAFSEGENKIEVYLEDYDYKPKDELKIFAKPLGLKDSEKPDYVNATFDSGTSFYVELPFAIPIINVKVIDDPSWWFIAVTIVSGLFVSYVFKLIKKKNNQDKIQNTV